MLHVAPLPHAKLPIVADARVTISATMSLPSARSSGSRTNGQAPKPGAPSEGLRAPANGLKQDKGDCLAISDKKEERARRSEAQTQAENSAFAAIYGKISIYFLHEHNACYKFVCLGPRLILLCQPML